jgi:NADH dehydrogenase
LRFTILRPAWVYGPGDAWTTRLAMVLKSAPFVFPVVGDGYTRLQPLWVEDLAACVERCLENQKTMGQTLTLGGPGYFTLNEVLDTIARALNVRRRKVFIRVPLARTLAETMERMMPRPLLTTTMVDLLGVDATTDISSVMRSFGFEPARFAETLDYLRGQPWRRRFWGMFFGRL